MAATGATGIDIGELAGEREVRECLQWFTREKQWINETHLQLCPVPAPEVASCQSHSSGIAGSRRVRYPRFRYTRVTDTGRSVIAFAPAAVCCST